jgi:Holliday junction resolvase
MTKSKGIQRERELFRLFYDHGYASMRAPNSGGGTKRELPDVIAGKMGETFAIEAKASSASPIYLTSDEMDSLLDFSEPIGAKPRVGVRYDHEDWYFFHPGDLHYTGDSYRIKKERALVKGTTIDELCTKTSPKIGLQEGFDAVESGDITESQMIRLFDF